MTKPTREEVTAATGVELNRLVELHCFGDDLSANTDDLIYSAVREWRISHPDDDQVRRSVALWRSSWCGYATPPITAVRWIWDNRAVLPWRESIEAHVAAWRAEPRDFIGNANILNELKDELRRRGWKFRTDWFPIFSLWGTIVKVGAWGPQFLADNEATALCRAAVLACMESEGE